MSYLYISDGAGARYENVERKFYKPLGTLGCYQNYQSNLGGRALWSTSLVVTNQNYNLIALVHEIFFRKKYRPSFFVFHRVLIVSVYVVVLFLKPWWRNAQGGGYDGKCVLRAARSERTGDLKL